MRRLEGTGVPSRVRCRNWQRPPKRTKQSLMRGPSAAYSGQRPLTEVPAMCRTHMTQSASKVEVEIRPTVNMISARYSTAPTMTWSQVVDWSGPRNHDGGQRRRCW